MQTTASKRSPGWWYPYIFVGGFSVVLAVNAVMMYSAVHTFSGIETEKAYEKGIAYNQILAKAATQKTLGWTSEVTVTPHPGSPATAHAADVSIRIADKDGKAVPGLIVSVQFVRPTQSGYDSSDSLTEQDVGVYSTLAKLPLPGQWDLRVDARKDNVDFQVGQRILVP